MTWRLGLKYIWIDSLCIIQDDIEDWRRKGSNMASIYSRAYITLAATSSTNCNGGFYTENTSVTQIPRYDPIYLRQSVNHRPFFENKLPLMSRAWVFQERMLSPRTIQFTSQELFGSAPPRKPANAAPAAKMNGPRRTRASMTGSLYPTLLYSRPRE
jgi:hypothetical protein